jgi:putative endonuclease
MSIWKQREHYVYIMSNVLNRLGTLYIGVTSDLEGRVYQHKRKLTPGFTSRYNIRFLVYAEDYPYADDAIAREKQLKGWRRDRKIALIEAENPDWRDLSEGWFE